MAVVDPLRVQWNLPQADSEDGEFDRDDEDNF